VIDAGDGPDGPDAFETLAGPGESRLEDRGSVFLGHARPVADVETAEAFVERVREEYADATHNVPCYRVRVEPRRPGVDPGGARDETGERAEAEAWTGADGGGGHLLREYQNDDGEPTGSAGKPALSVLRGRDVENAVVVVTRYFGGTELGVGGLVRAYSRATAGAVDDAGVVTRRPQTRFTAVVDYDDSGTVRGLLESADCAFEATYEARVTFEVRCARADAAAVRDRLRSATSGRVELS